MELGGNGKDQVIIGHIRKAGPSGFDPFFRAAIVALGAGPIPAGSALRFDLAARRARLLQYSVFLGATLFEVEQRLSMTRRHVLLIFIQVLRGKPVKDGDEFVHSYRVTCP